MNLLFRFNSDGTLKEFTGGNLIQSSIKSDTLYVKVDDVDVSNFVAMAEYKRPDGQVSNDIAMAYGEVPFGLGDGFRQTIPAWCTQLDGQLEITIRLLTFTSNGDKRVFAMAKNVVKVLASTSAGDGEVNITDEQYDALLETLANKSLNEVVGKDVEEYLNQKFEEKSGLIDEYLEEQTSRIENEIDTELKEMDDTIKGLGNLEPSGTDLANNILAFTENKGIYVATDTGGWYYWKQDVSKYVYGGVFQSTEIADNSITPKKTTFIEDNILYENKLVEVSYTGDWQSHVLTITNFTPNEKYTFYVEEVSGIDANCKQPVTIKTFDSSGTQLTYQNIMNDDLTERVIEVLPPETATKIEIKFNATMGSSSGSGVALFKNVYFVKGDKPKYKLSEEIEVGKITPEKTTFIEKEIVKTKNLLELTNQNSNWYGTLEYKVVNGAIILNGTANLNSYINIPINLKLSSNSSLVLFNENIEGLSNATLFFQKTGNDYSTGINITDTKLSTRLFVTGDTEYTNILINIGQNEVVSNLTIKPMVVSGLDVPSEFVLPYEEVYTLDKNINVKNNNIYKKYGLPVLYLEGNTDGISKDNKVNLNYLYNGRKGTCTLKWQGSSSLAYPKKNYTIKFDNPFEAKEGWGEQKKYCLKANYIDFSHARNVVSAKLWGQVVKSRTNVPTQLSSLVNGGAIDGFPICVVINGEYQGIYTFNIPKDDWMFGMGSLETEAIVGAGNHGDVTKFKATPIFDENNFEIEYAPDEDNTTWIENSITNLYNALQSATAENFDSSVGSLIDIDSVIDYFIFANLITGIDMTNKNYLLATFNGNKWFMSAYDLDSTYGLNWDASSFLSAKTTAINWWSYSSENKLMECIKNFKKEELKARYQVLRSNVLSEENIAVEFNNFIGLIPKALLDEEVKIWTGIKLTSVNSASQIIDHYRDRCKYCDNTINKL